MATAQAPTIAGVAAASAAVRVQVVAAVVSSAAVPATTVQPSTPELSDAKTMSRPLEPAALAQRGVTLEANLEGSGEGVRLAAVRTVARL